MKVSKLLTLWLLFSILGCASADNFSLVEREILSFLDNCEVKSLKETDDKLFSTWKAVCGDDTYDCTTHSGERKDFNTYCKSETSGKRISLWVNDKFRKVYKKGI